MKVWQIKLGSISAILIAATSLVLVPLTSAQSNGSALQISPVKTVLNANPGDKKQIDITVKSLAQATIKYTALFDNFTAGSELGEPKIVADPNLPHGIKAWLSGPAAITLNSNSSGTYTVAIAVPVGAAPGTYYGLVRFAGSDAAASVGSLLFVNVGTITQQVAIEELDTTAIVVDSLGEAKGKFAVRLKNTGNGYTVPGLKIEILDDKKIVIDTLDANPTTASSSAGGVLPDGSIRKYSADYSKKLQAGRAYSARVTATAGASKPVVTEKTFAKAAPPAGSNLNVKPPTAKKDNSSLFVIGVIIAVLGGGGILLAVLAKKRKMSRMPSAYMPEGPAHPLYPNASDAAVSTAQPVSPAPLPTPTAETPSQPVMPVPPPQTPPQNQAGGAPPTKIIIK